MSIDENELQEFMGRVVVDMGAAFLAANVVIGESLGLYEALKERGPLSSDALAEATGTSERYVREWANGQAAGGYISFADGKYYLSEIQAFTMATPDSPAYVPGGFEIAVAVSRAHRDIADCFRTGEGFAWGRHDPGLFHGTEKFFRPNYAAHLVENWLPALDGVVEKLEAGADVADLGCGLGASTLLMARAFPSSRFRGFDFHQESIQCARANAEKAGVDVEFSVADSKSFPGTYDLICFFDAFHDMGDPKGVSRTVRSHLKDGGTWMLVEPFANDDVEDNLNPIGRLFYSASTLICTPCALAQEGGYALGNQAGEAKTRALVLAGGFSSFRRATETPFNLIYEAKA